MQTSRDHGPRRYVPRRMQVLGICLFLTALASAPILAADDTSNVTATFRQYCVQCHGKAAAMAGLNLEKLSAVPAWGENFERWQKVAAALADKRMPPAKMAQPGDAERNRAALWIRTRLNEFATKNAGDPGKVTVRRLTSGEYAYTIRDLTGIDVKVDRDFVSDSVGGEGFTNYGDVQFMQDANLERYLHMAKYVADHAVIGAGPIQFFADAGKSGFELSAIDRIQKIYTTHGFRASSGEGGKPFGTERYGKALFASWRYLHRKALGAGNASLKDMAVREGVSPKFVEHIWGVLQRQNTVFPTDEVVSKWKQLPAPGGADRERVTANVRNACNEIQRFITDWPRWLFAAGGVAEGGQGDERSLVLNEASIQAVQTYRFRFNVRGDGKKTPARMYFTALSANPKSKDKPVIVWRAPTVRYRKADRSAGSQHPLVEVLDEAARQKFGFGKSYPGVDVRPQDFATVTDASFFIEIPAPEGTSSVELQVEAAIGAAPSGDAVIRCTMSDNEEPSKGRPISALLGDPKSAGFLAWKANVLDFAENLPQTSHGEATPSDKDPIPPPYDNTYNQPERDSFHTRVKYYRTDRFLSEKMLDDATRVKLDQAWNDLLSSFEYHDVFLNFVAGKYKLDSKKGIAAWSAAEIAALPEEPRRYVQALRTEYDAVQRTEQAAESGHVEDCLRFAAKAWRRPLTATEKEQLRSFYRKTKDGVKPDHEKAIRALLARILVAPAFLYRLEQPSLSSGVKELTGYELANRLSYFLWASMPDDELMRAAAAGELSQAPQLARQVKRMLADRKARRLSTELFGQWLGFYRFDQYSGVDTGRFPEFTDDLKSAMYDEAVTFFEHVIRKDRPVREMLFADYTFANQTLAKHYGVTRKFASPTAPELIEGAGAFQRGGMLRLGAVLTVTSAPLRTSPVKRGDWVLRRILGTPTPPPPADAGSIPADEKSFGGLSLSERLAQHQRNPTCAGCHSRIDPMGFPLERYDAIGRWRDTYSDGKPVHDSSVTADKTPIAGVTGLLDYMKSQEKQVLQTLSHKLLGYALGRTILASDQPLIDKMVEAGGDASFSKLAVEIVSSRQFRYRRDVAEAAPAVAAKTLSKAGQR